MSVLGAPAVARRRNGGDGRRFRIWELSAELGLTSAQVRWRLEQLGWPTRTHASTVPAEAAETLRQAVTPLPDPVTRRQSTSWGTYFRFSVYLTRQTTSWVGIFLLTLASGAVSLLTPWPLKVMADQVLGRRPVTGWLLHLPGATSRSGLISLVAVATIVIFAAASGIEVLLTTSWVRTGQAMVYDLAADVLRRLQRRSVLFHGSQAVGDSMSRVVVDSHALGSAVADLVVSPLHALVLSASMLLVLVRLDPALAVIAIVTAPVIAACSAALGRLLRQASRSTRDTHTDVQSHVHQALSGIAVVQAFGQEKRERGLFDMLAAT
ncbi:MAG TPA: ABC transporter transmembrane domain-containing protein, partial [Chloroflexota bacterium]|nr:ABC transporter transmembrane domain-containing protein [Chloroflexota bacterium]